MQIFFCGTYKIFKALNGFPESFLVFPLLYFNIQLSIEGENVNLKLLQ